MRRKKKRPAGSSSTETSNDDGSASGMGAQKAVRIGTPLEAALAGVSLKPARQHGAATAAKTPGRTRPATEAPQPILTGSKTETQQDAPHADPTGPNPPSASYGYEDRVALRQALSGVAPLRRRPGNAKRMGTEPDRREHVTSRGSPAPRGAHPEVAKARRGAGADTEAKRRFDALTSAGGRFVLQQEPDWVEGYREGAGSRALRDLKGGRARAEVELDLHGYREEEAVRALVAFLRRERARGCRIAKVIHGRGVHSQGAPVLRRAVLAAIVEGPAHMLVSALSTCARTEGGEGAMLLRLDVR